MTAMTILPHAHEFTARDREDFPDDGNRYELIDGSLIVTPSPMTRHQSIVGEFYLLLRAACPSQMRVLLSPYDVAISDNTVMQPDLLVADKAAFGEKNLPGAPLLAIEVLSLSTRLIDLGLKRSRYEVARCPSYWTVDPDGPSVTAWELRDGAYVEVGQATGDQTLRLERPFRVSIVPSKLLQF
jgi:Uma2 family endonuclease